MGGAIDESVGGVDRGGGTGGAVLGAVRRGTVVGVSRSIISSNALSSE